MIQLRSGTFGRYYGSTSGSSASLTEAQMEVNAQYIYSYLMNEGWTEEAIAGTLGNMHHESALNPGRWQSDSVGNESGGFGLVQWTPATRHLSWCEERGMEPGAMDSNLAHLVWEIHEGDDYYPTEDYPESFEEFTKSRKAPFYLACAFAWNYERSATVLWGTEAEKEALRNKRGGSAENWYTYLLGREPTKPGGSPKARKRKYNFLLFGKKAWRNSL